MSIVWCISGQSAPGFCVRLIVMNSGDVRTFKRGDGNAVVLAIGIWAARSTDHIRIDITGAGGSNTTVTNDPDSARCYRTLFRDLRAL